MRVAPVGDVEAPGFVDAVQPVEARTVEVDEERGALAQGHRSCIEAVSSSVVAVLTCMQDGQALQVCNQLLYTAFDGCVHGDQLGVGIAEDGALGRELEEQRACPDKRFDVAVRLRIGG
jgi:hypothetical protein